MTIKRRKPWWHLLRGPRGHRGLPGPTGESGATPLLTKWVAFVDERFVKLEERVADLERKLGGSQK